MKFEYKTLSNEAEQKDLSQLIELYTTLHDNAIPVVDVRIENVWSKYHNG